MRYSVLVGLLALLSGGESGTTDGTDCRVVASIVSLEDDWAELQTKHPHEARIAEYIDESGPFAEYTEAYLVCRQQFR